MLSTNITSVNRVTRVLRESLRKSFRRTSATFAKSSPYVRRETWRGRQSAKRKGNSWRSLRHRSGASDMVHLHHIEVEVCGAIPPNIGGSITAVSDIHKHQTVNPMSGIEQAFQQVHWLQGHVVRFDDHSCTVDRIDPISNVKFRASISRPWPVCDDQLRSLTSFS